MAYRQHPRDGIGSSLMNMANGLNTIQAMGQRNQTFQNEQITFDQKQTDKTKALQSKEDINTNFEALKTGPTQARPYEVDGAYVSPDKLEQPVALKGTATDKLEGKLLYGKDMAADAGIKELRDSAAVSEYTNKLFQGFNAVKDKRGYISALNPQDKNEAQAIFKFMEFVNKNKEYNIESIKLSQEQGALEFEEFINSVMMAGEYHQKGMTQQGAKTLQGAIDKAHHPLFVQDNKDGTWDLVYKEGEEEETLQDDVSFEEIFTFAKQITPEKFINDRIAQKKMWAEKNNKSLGNAVTWTNGKETVSVSRFFDQNRPIDGTLVVFVDKTGKRFDGGNGMSVEELRGKKFKPQNLADDANKALINQRNASTNASDRSNPASKVQRKQLEDVITQAAKFFGDGKGTILFDENGELSQSGDNTRIKALEFYEQYKSNPNVLDGTEYQKFQIAKALKAATNSYFGVTPKQNTPQKQLSQDDVSMQGGKQDKSGSWWVPVQGMKDKWEKVELMNTPQPLEPQGQQPTQAMVEPIPNITNDYQPSQTDVIGEVNGFPVARVGQDFMVQDQNGWRQPLPEEQKQIAQMNNQAMTGSSNLNMGIRNTGAQKIKLPN
jgi:hypothetical protein